MKIDLNKIYNYSFWAIYITQFTFGFSLFYLSTYGITLIDINIWLCFALLLFAFFILNQGLKIAKNPPNIFLILFNGSIFFSFAFLFLSGTAISNGQLIKSTSHYYYVFGFLILIFSSLLQPETYYRKIIPTLIVLLTFFNLYGIYQLFARLYGLPLGWIEYTNKGIFSRLEIFTGVQQAIMSYGYFIRATSIFTEPSVLASFNVYLLIFLIIPWIQFRESFIRNNVLSTIFIAISIITLFFTYSMTGTLGLILIFVLVLFLEKYSSYKKTLIIVVICIGLLVFANWMAIEFIHTDLFELFSFRFKSLISLGKEEIGGESLSGRLDNLAQSFRVFLENPLFGVGMGLLGYQPNFDYMFSDSSLFSILSEVGIFAGLFFIAMMLSLFYYSVNLYKLVQRSIIFNLNNGEKKLIGVIPYIVLFEIFRTFFTVNYLSYFAFWMNIAFAFMVINYYSKFLKFPYWLIKFKKD